MIGRFLEHSRIFHFGNGGHDEYWIGSADMMHRNLDRRVEALVQVKDPSAVERMAKMLALLGGPGHEVLGARVRTAGVARRSPAVGIRRRCSCAAVPVPNDPATVLAAGGLLWRPAKGRATASRWRSSTDRGIATGRCPRARRNRGETTPLTAWREIKEETGFRLRSGPQAHHGAVCRWRPAESRGVLRGPGRRRRVHAEPRGRHARAGCRSSAARSLLSYEFDVAVLDNFAVQPADLTSVVLVRHARAGAREVVGRPRRVAPAGRQGPQAGGCAA